MNGSNKSICIVILKLIFLSLTLDTFSMPKVAINLPEIYFDFKDTQTHRNNKTKTKKLNIETTEKRPIHLTLTLHPRYTHTLTQLETKTKHYYIKTKKKP